MSGKQSASPVERAEAELEDLMAEFNQLVSGQDGKESQDDDGFSDGEPEPQTDDEEGNRQNPPPKQDDDSYKKRWESLQGIVKSKDAQIAQLTTQIDNLLVQNEQILNQLQENRNQTQSAQQTTGDQVSSENLEGLADMLRDQFGDEIGDVFDKFAKHIKKIEDRGNTVNNKLEEVANRITTSKLEDRISELCPTWRTVNVDQGFIAWLQKPAPYSTKKMIDILNESYSSGDVDTTAAIFNEYIGANTTKATARDPRESMVTPGSSSSSSQSSGTQQKIWTEAETERFFRDVQAQKYRGREADAQRIENEISLAYLEGRVR